MVGSINGIHRLVGSENVRDPSSTTVFLAFHAGKNQRSAIDNTSAVCQGRRYWGFGGPDPLKICRSGRSVLKE